VTTRNVGNTQEGYSYFPFLEAFRSLHANIGFLGSDTPIQSLVISSAIQGDGKSTVAHHLAESAAAMGRRVLLVDADLRRPQVHTKLGLSNELGLSNVISTNLPVLDAIQRSPSTDDLFVLTSGQSPPDPIKLLSSKKMQNLMHQLRQEFDLVIYDTPPLVGFADGSLLGTYTNGIMLVVRMDKTDISAVKQALDGLKISRATILGIVSNCAKKYSNSAYNYYYRTPAQNIG
jgi:capsular exopolysaccharide synthesis family protein